MLTGAQSIVKSLEQHGVEFVFGMPGAQNLELVDALIDSRIRSVLVTSEISAAFMADGYARSTGKVGVCASIAGPGLTYMITGLAEAFVDSFPVVLLTSGLDESETNYHIHQIEQLNVVEPIVKRVIRIESCSNIPKTIGEAFCVARDGEPGPVVIEIPVHVFRDKADYIPYIGSSAKQPIPQMRATIKRIAEMVRSSNACGIYAGAGALSAGAQIRELAERFSMPVATTISGKGILPDDHDLAVGFGFSPSGTMIAEEVFKRCDTLLALGCKFSEMSTGKWSMQVPTKLIHIDTNKAVFNQNYPAEVTLCEDVSTALDELLSELRYDHRDSDRNLIDEIRKGKADAAVADSQKRGGLGVSPSRLLREVRKRIERDAVFVTDCGNHQLFAITDFEVFEPRSFLTPSNYMAMGFGVPAAIGASLGSPYKRIVCLCGDGGFLISGFELLTAVREKLKFSVIICNDGALGLIKGSQKRVYGRTSSVDLVSPDYKQLAAAFGVEYIEINEGGDLAIGLERMVRSDGVVMVNVKVDYAQWSRNQKGMAKASWQRLPLLMKLNLLGRRAARTLSSITREGD